MSILIKDIPLAGYEISIMKDGERYRARVDGIWCEVEEIPTTDTGSDTISRQAAIDGKICIQRANGVEIYDDYAVPVEYLKQLPPIQPKRGKWHYSDGKPARIGLSFGVICDQCGTESEYCTNFCGECGADMREVTE